MKKFFKISVLVFTIALLTASCKPLEEQIAINGCELESLESVSLEAGLMTFGTVLTLDAANTSCSDISLKKLNATILSKSGKEVATVTFSGKKGEKNPTLHHRSSEAVAVPLTVSFDNPLSALSLASMALEDYGKKGYTVNYDCTLRAGCLAKRFVGNNVPIEEIVKMFDK